MKFTNSIDYPCKQGEILPYGDLWNYVSHTFLNGFINYYKVESCFVVPRYWEEDEQEEGIQSIKDFNTGKKKMHTDLRTFGDDVWLLGKKENFDEWCLFIYDMDVSDCSIGRFQDSRDKAMVVNDFEIYCNEARALTYPSSDMEIIEINKQNICGWIKF